MNEIKLPPYVVNEFGPVLPQSQTLDWGMNMLNIPRIHNDYGLTGKGIKIAVVDTGIDPEHPDLKGAVYKVINATSESFSAANGHGIGAAGIIAARNNSSGVLGVAPDSQILAIKGMRESGGGSFDELIKAIEYAIANNVDIINLSLGSATNVSGFRAVINKAVAAGIHVVCAAGNNGRDNSVTFPAKYPNTIGVGAVNQSGYVSAFSSRGWEVDIAAPGEKVLTTWKNKSYARVSGTSFACPYTVGVIALLLEAGVKVTSERLESTAIDIGKEGPDTGSGHGIIDGLAMLRNYRNKPTPAPVTPVPSPPDDGMLKVKQAVHLLNEFLNGA